MARDILTAFANNGDKTNIPDGVQPNGSVSYEEGWGSQYEIDPAAGGRRLVKNNFNDLFNLITTNQKELVDQGVINHIVGKSYLVNAKVRGTDGNNYVSNKTTVLAPPSADWDIDAVSSGREVATSEEIRTGTDNEKVITPKGFNETSLGWGQTWQDVTASRSLGVTYTNNTGRPIRVDIDLNGTNGGQAYSFIVDGKTVLSNSGFGFTQGGNMLVPNGSTYSLTSSVSVKKWHELR